MSRPINAGDIEIDNYDDFVLWTGDNYVTICGVDQIDTLIKNLNTLKEKFDKGIHTPVEVE